MMLHSTAIDNVSDGQEHRWTHFGGLDVQGLTFSFLTLDDLAHVGVVCKRWHGVVFSEPDECLWKRMCLANCMPESSTILRSYFSFCKQLVDDGRLMRKANALQTLSAMVLKCRSSACIADEIRVQALFRRLLERTPSNFELHLEYAGNPPQYASHSRLNC
jgi:hypothetical protein